jgi:ribosomal protein L37AE/L43A
MTPTVWMGRWVCEKCKKAWEGDGFLSEDAAEHWSRMAEAKHWKECHAHVALSS